MSTTQTRAHVLPEPAAGALRRRRRRAGGPALWFAAPALAIYALVVLYPSLAGAVYAFTSWSGIGSAKWVGLDNFKTLFSDDQSFTSLKNTLELTAFIVVVQNAMACS